ncbi:LAFA_0C02982g1_1 [Lachancea sp. 'fantastica']|nr:LAFA_0C02982g1_1 [Lachancea sp. 'fantastica']
MSGHHLLNASGVFSAAGPDRATTNIKICELKAGRTLLKHTSPEIPKFQYNPFDLEENPSVLIHETKQLKVSLVLDSDTFYFQNMDTESLLKVSCNDGNTTPKRQRSSTNLVCGTLRLTVKGLKEVPLKNVQVRLSGYSHECGYEIQDNVVRIVNRSESSTGPSFKIPFIQDVVVFNTHEHNHGDHLEILPPGSYEYRFEFPLEPGLFPGSLKSHRGSVSYRVESFITVLRPKSKFETILLSSIVSLKNTVPIDRYALLQTHSAFGRWRNGLVEYDIFLGSRLLKASASFQVSIDLSRRLDICAIDSVCVSLHQTMTIPCYDRESRRTNGECYDESTSWCLREHPVSEDNQTFFNLVFNDLTIPPFSKKAYSDKRFFPSYIEFGSCLLGTDENTIKLKISHTINITIRARIKLGKGSSSSECYQIKLKFPVIIAEHDSNFYTDLPRYQSRVESAAAAAPQRNLSVLTPPKYSETIDEMQTS